MSRRQSIAMLLLLLLGLLPHRVLAATSTVVLTVDGMT